MRGNAFENIIGILESQDENDVNLKYRSLKEGLKVAAEKVDLDALNSIHEEIKILLENNTGLEESGGGVGQASSKGTHDTGHDIYPKPPSYFKLATIKNANKEEKVIHLEVQSENVPTCGDGCATNIKAAYLVSKELSSFYKMWVSCISRDNEAVVYFIDDVQ